MKKVLSLMLSMLLLAVFAGSALAVPGNGNAHSKGIVKSYEKALEKRAEAVKETPTVKQAVKQQITVKKSLKEDYKAKIQALKQERITSHFKDCEKHWASESIELLSAAGLFTGYPDGTFQPDNAITQAESIALVMRLAEDQEIASTDSDAAQDESISEEDIEETTDEGTNVTDTENEEALEEVPAWAREFAGKAARKGFINLNRFHSEVQASRAQTAVWIAKAIGLQPADTSEMPFADCLFISAEDAGYIMALYQEGIIKGTPSGNFNPNSAITRAQMAAIMERILEERAIESVTLSEENITIQQGESITLTTNVDLADGSSSNVTWSTSNAELATVEDGTVTIAADQTGTVIITATVTQDGVSISASCTITVEAESTDPESSEEDTDTDATDGTTELEESAENEDV